MGIYVGTDKLSKVYYGTQEVKSIYMGIEKTYSSIPTLTALQITGDWQYEQYYNCYVNYTGLTFTAVYSNGDTKVVTPTSYSPKIWTTSGRCTFNYTEDGVTVSAASSYVYPSEVEGLYFIAKEPNSTISLQAVGNAPQISLEYFDSRSTSWNTYTVGDTITLQTTDEAVYFRGNNERYASSLNDYNHFVMTGKWWIQGSMEYLHNDTGLSSYTFCKLFSNCTSLVLRSLNLLYSSAGNYSCAYMFEGCTNLGSPATLSSITTLGDYCFMGMFSGCTTLAFTPNLPATTLKVGSYKEMFKNCTSLHSSPMGYISATSVANNCCESMFEGCTNLWSLPALYATSLAPECYKSMFKNCTSLVVQTRSRSPYSTAYRIPMTGTGSGQQNALTDMFAGIRSTMGSLTGTPSMNTTYYVYEVV